MSDEVSIFISVLNTLLYGKAQGQSRDPAEGADESDVEKGASTVSNTVTVTLQPNVSEIYRGETITVRCEIQGGGDTEWEYEWETTTSFKPSNQHEHRISSASSSHSGDYRCKGRVKSSQHRTTEWSSSVRLTVYDNKPRPVLTVSPSWLSPGASVTLNCEVEHPSAGWRFYWYKTVPDLSHNYYSYKLLPGNSRGTEQDSYIVHGQTHTAGYVCRAGRGDPVFYTDNSEPKFVWSGDLHPAASLTVNPDRVQHFYSDSVSLSCEGNSTEWRVKRFNEHGSLSHCSDWWRMTGSTCKVYLSSPINAVYWCESGSGEFSNAVNITVQNDYYGIILVSPVHPVTEGESVSLGCRFRTEEKLSSVFFYHNDKLIQNDTRQELNISAVSKSDEGFYKCQWSGRKSAQSWMSVKVSNSITVILQPNWPLIYSSETITVRCEIQGGGDTGWMYEWRPAKLNKPPSHNEYRINRATESDSGDYRCKARSEYFLTEWSDKVTLTVSPRKPEAQLTADKTAFPAGGSVTLTCSVNPSPGWKYFLYRDNKLSEPLTTHDAAFQTTGRTSVSQEGLYSCRGGRGAPVYYTEYSHSVSIDITVSNRAVVILQPNWSEIYRGETITVRCEIQGGGDTEWEYKWKTTTSFKPSNQHEHRISSASSSHSGDYRCKGRVKSSQHRTTEWSSSVRLTVYDNKPRPVLTVSPSWLSPGASVTLNCEVEHPSAGWRFYWYKTVPDLSHNSYSYELLPGNSRGTEQDSYIVHGQTHTAGYVCRARRGDPVFYTDNSEPKFVWSGDLHPAASLTVNPDRVQHFTSDSVSLSCEGNSAEWRVKRFPEHGYMSHCSDWRRMTGSTCNIHLHWHNDAVYWCESGSGEFSNAVNITVQNDYYGIILVSPVHPVTEGESVSLGCRFRTEEKLSSVFFYHNDKLIQNDTRQELTISAVSKSDEGFYKCQWSERKSAQSWMSVKVAVMEPKSSSSPVLLIVLLLCGIVLIILLLLCCCRKSTDPCWNRLTQSQRENKATDKTVSHDDNQQQTYSSLLQGQFFIYLSMFS
ncbi:Fc receptor-like protein 5 [Lates calcarifer]|uniref:Fc receptor-like protein 5 n=1 Tax=Lates calcarifer TaxID=8187 RepID=A0AAJ8B0T2_LATCA|nr:Fc receptor-like protein 5 [Lates calcarifer]